MPGLSGMVNVWETRKAAKPQGYRVEESALARAAWFTRTREAHRQQLKLEEVFFVCFVFFVFF